ncbi:hypothetical protein D3C78_1442880 [compost metagenome]
MAVDDQAGDLVLFVGDQRLVEEALERDIGQRHLRGDAFGIAAGGDSGQAVAGARRAGLGQQFPEAVEAPVLAADAVCVSGHGNSLVDGNLGPMVASGNRQDLTRGLAVRRLRSTCVRVLHIAPGWRRAIFPKEVRGGPGTAGRVSSVAIARVRHGICCMIA